MGKPKDDLWTDDVPERHLRAADGMHRPQRELAGDGTL